MFGIILSALNAFVGPILALLLRQLLLKFIAFTVIYLVVVAACTALMTSGFLPSATSLKNSMAGLPATVSYFMTMFGMFKGLAMIFSAYAVRFIIRRMPGVN